MRIDLLEETLERLEREGAPAEVHLHRADLPEPGRRDALRAAPASGWSRSRASASCSCSRTTRTACCATRASRCRRCTRSTAASTSSTSARSRRSSRRASGSDGWRRPAPVLAKIKLGKQAADLCTSSLTQQLVDAYFEEGRWRALRTGPVRASTASGATRCSTRSPSSSRAEAEWTQPGGGLFIWATLPDFIDTERPAREGDPRGARRVRARLGRVRRRPRRQLDAAQLLRRGRRTTSSRASGASARWSTSRSSLYGTFTGRAAGASDRAGRRRAGPQPCRRDVGRARRGVRSERAERDASGS